MAAKYTTFTYVPAYQGDEGLVLLYQEANSQVFVKGDLVVANAAGDISLAGADPTKILGIAQAPATNVTTGNKWIPVNVIRPSDTFNAHFIAAKALALTDIDAGFEIVRTAAGRWEIDSTAAANNMRVRILSPLVFTADGLPDFTTGGVPVHCRFLEASGATVNILQFSSVA